MGARDSGWIQIYAENNQEAYDNFIMAIPIGEAPEVRLPVMTCMDGFITSHAVENIDLLETDVVRKFVGVYNPEHYLLKEENPLAVGPYDISPYYMEHKVQQAEAMKAAKARILEVAAEFARISGRRYGLFEEYRMEDAQLAIVLIGSTAGTAKAAVDKLRRQGVKAGLIKVRVFRPFPGEELAKALAGTKAVAVMDKSEGFSGGGGPLFAETRSALYDLKERPYLINIVYGLGGRDVRIEDIEKVYNRLASIADNGDIHPAYSHMGHRSKEEMA
jgi:pyruvate ferredoxin oxidoreductase alpha subunit